MKKKKKVSFHLNCLNARGSPVSSPFTIHSPNPATGSSPWLPSWNRSPTPLTYIRTLFPGFLRFILALVQTARNLHKCKPDNICSFSKTIQWFLIILKEKKSSSLPQFGSSLLFWLQMSPPTLPHPSVHKQAEHHAADALACSVSPASVSFVSISGPLIC